MKPITTAIICVAMATATTTIFAAESYGDTPIWGPSPAADAAGAREGEMAVLTQKGLSPPRASEALAVQAEIGRLGLLGEIEAALGQQYAGVWFEPATAQFHIGVPSAASGLAVEQMAAQHGVTDDIVATPVRTTWSSLMAVQGRWNNVLERLLPARDAKTGLDAQRNAMVVTLSSGVPSRQRFALERKAASEPVNVLVSTASAERLGAEPIATCKLPYCEKTLVSGVSIETPVLVCTAGPMLIEGNETYMVTAGHCFGEAEANGVAFNKSKVTSAYPNVAGQVEIGKEGVQYFTKARDMAILKIIQGGHWTAALPTPVPALMAEWGKKTEEPQAIIADAASAKGETNCHQGQTSGEQCGEVLEVNVTFPGVFEHLVEDTACAEGGDSGGPFGFSESKVDNVRVQGIAVRANTTKKCSEGEKGSWYEPLLDEGAAGFGILATFGRAMLTSANQTRPCAGGTPVIACWAEKEHGEFKELSGEEEVLLELASGKALLTSTVGGEKVEIECTDTIPAEALILQPSPKEKAGEIDAKLEFTGCVLLGTLGEKCKVPETRTTTALVGTLESATKVSFKPREGTTLVEIPFEEKSKCPATLKGTKKVTGKQISEWSTDIEEAIGKHVLTSGKGELLLAENEATLESKYNITLTNKSFWGI